MIYLLHFHKPISDGHTCQHYIGYAEDVPARLQSHTSGHGARLTQVAKERGIRWSVVRLWTGDRKRERELKNLKAANKLCPVCNPGNERALDGSIAGVELTAALIPF